MTSSLIGRQAVVVGAGMAGLPAACVRSDYFEHVTVLERGRRSGLAQLSQPCCPRWASI